jgi:hypothetical protein
MRYEVEAHGTSIHSPNVKVVERLDLIKSKREVSVSDVSRILQISGFYPYDT